MIAVGSIAGLAPRGQAANVETLLMPGKLAAAHAKYEADCSNCHDKTDRSRQTALCLDCHDKVMDDIKAKRGFHGRLAAIETGACAACHSEHHGRDGDVLNFNPATFNHQQTDFKLEGAHQSVACTACHKKGKLYREASSSCGNCHKDDDLHDGQLGAKCGDCHNNSTWAAAKYDHGKTKFALVGKHKDVACNACHLGGKYKNAPLSCISCHLPDDAHRGDRGENCAECHTPSGWTVSKFDHAKETGFALLGRHNVIACNDCHKTGRMEDEIPNTCIGCHAADDSHAGRFGEKCNDCHNNDGWANMDYDHLARNKFALEGAHAKLDCHACHTTAVAKAKPGKECIDCHRATDPHGEKLGIACDSCHGTNDWHSDIAFDHDLTEFPLLGMHVAVSCAQCHRTLEFKDAPQECNGCHADRDVHKGGLGEECANCHNTNGWEIWDFDHAKETGFALTGAHGKLKCADCHRRPAGEVKLAQDCASCHRDDDIHLGQYGRQCQRCHTTITFKGARIQ